VFVVAEFNRSGPPAMGIGLPQGYVLSPLLFIVYMNWIDNQSRVDEGVTVRSCRINHFIFCGQFCTVCIF